MENAAPLFGLAATLFGLGFVIHAVASWWVRAKHLEREELSRAVGPGAEPAVAARLARIEQAIEAVAVEVERIGEAQRFAVGLRAERIGAAPPRATDDVEQ